jgi:hypothetical protein
MTQTKAELLQTRHQGDIRLGDADSTHYVGLKAPATVASNLVWSLPAADGSANQVLKTDGSGALGWASDANAPEGTAVLSTGETGTTKYLRVDGDNTCSWQLAVDATKMPLAGGSFTGDVVFTGDAANVTWDKSTDDLIFNDNAKAIFGTGSDLEIYHTGSGSYIQNKTGTLFIGSNYDDDDGGDIRIQPKYGENSIVALDDGAVELYCDNVKKIETTSTGVDVTGTAVVDGITIDGAYEQVAEAVGALEIDCSTGNYFTKTISGNSTFTFANPAASGSVTSFTLELTHSSGTITWPASVKWNADTAPTLTAGKTHLFMFVTDDGGTRYRGSALVDYVN